MQSKLLRLKILTASLKLKFKCRLKIQCAEGGATQQATTINGLYDVDQELQLYPKKNEIELLLTLISEKGSSYNGGIVRTSIEQLRYSIGSAIKLSVSKCIDKQAWIQLKVISVPYLQDKENKKDLSFTDHREDGFFLKEAQFTPDRVKKGNLVLQTNLGETRSQHGFALPSSSFKLEDRKKIYDTARPNFGQFSNVRMHKNRDSRKISPFQSSPRRQSPEQMHRMEEYNRSRDQAQRSASKLKRLQQKCKQEQQRVIQQQQKRKKIESSEHNYKIQLTKVNIAKEQKEKQIAKKDSRIKQLQFECVKAKENAKKLNQLKEELKAKETQTKFLEDDLDAERKLAQQWKSMAEEQSKRVGEQADKYRKLHDTIANEKNDAIQQLTKKMKAKDEEIAIYLNRIVSIQESNQRDKKHKQGVDMKTNQTKSQLEKVISLLKKDLKQSKDQYSVSCLKAEQQKSLLSHELTILKEECDKLRMITSKATIQKRSLEQKIDDNQQKIGQMKRYREKYTEQNNKYKTVKDELGKLKRKYETALEQNHKYEERLNLALKNMEQLRKDVHSKDIKHIELQQRLKNLEESSSESKTMLQKQRKGEEMLQKECSQMREKEKQLKSQFSKKEIQLARLKLQLQNANEKIMQLKSVKHQQQQQQKSQPVVQHQDWENSKANSVLQVQRFLEMQLINSKQSIADLESSNVRIKEQLQKWVRAEYQWRENERIWEAERIRVSAQVAKSAKEVKDLTKRLAQEDARALILNEKIEKEKKVSKGWQEKYFASEASLKKINDSKEEASSELQIKESKMRMLENQLIFVRGELEQREAQAKRYKSVHDTLETQNKKLRQEVSDLTFRVKEEEQLTITQSKKSRQEMTKYEARLTNIKRQFQKFKENLRNVLVESIISQLSRDQQEKQITLRRRQAKLGLTLTNELLIKLEEYLRELSRHKSETQGKLRATQKELIASREEIILKTNQYQNTEGQLKFKLDELIDNLQKMKNIYSEREQQLRKTVSDLQWQLSLKDNQIEKMSASLKEVTETQQRDSLIASDNFVRNEKALCSEIEKLRVKLNESSQREAAYFGQITSLEEYITGIESNLNNSDNKVVFLEQQLDRKQKQVAESASQIQHFKQTVAELSKQKSELKNVVLVFESEVQQCKLVISQYKSEIAVLQKEKNEQSTLIRSLMKEKESFLHQYLASEQKIFHFETRQYELEEKIAAMEEQRQKDAQTIQEARKKATQQAKTYEANLMKKQTERESQVRRLEEKLKEKEKVVTLLNQRNTSTEELLSQVRLKLDTVNKASQSTENELHQAIIKLQQQNRQYIFQNQVLSKKNSELESQLRKHRESSTQLNISIEQLNKTLTQYITANNKLEAELFSNKSDLTQLREDYLKIKAELEEKDLQNYEISSNFFKNETEFAEKIDHLQQKVAMQEESMIKYQEICQEYSAEIEALKKSNQTLTSINAQSQAEIARTVAKCKLANQEIEVNYETIRQLEQQLRRPSYLRKEKTEPSYPYANLSLQRGGELGI